MDKKWRSTSWGRVICKYVCLWNELETIFYILPDLKYCAYTVIVIFCIVHLISLSKFNLPLIGTFYVTHATRALESHDLSGEGIKLWITYILFWPHKDMESLPGWVISPMPGPPPRQHKHERQYTPSTHSVIPTRRILNDDDDGQMIFVDLGGLKFPDICLTGEKNPEKTHPGKLSRPGIEPGPAAWQTRMLPLAPQRWTISSFKINSSAAARFALFLNFASL